MKVKELLRLVTPPLFIRLASLLREKRESETLWLSGDFQSWNDALAASTGYDSEIILNKTKAALLKVKNGEAVHERDTVLFDEIQYAWPVLAGLMWAAARNGGLLNVLDFGGSLGSTYFQNRLFLSGLPGIRWNVIEQPSHVKAGKEYFEDDVLKFYGGIKDCLAETQPNVVLLSGVLQYLEHPYRILDEIRELPLGCMIIDRTPLWEGTADRLCIQTVPSDIYPASYPSWIFSRSKLTAYLEGTMRIIEQFDSLDRLTAPVYAFWKGFIIEHKEHSRTRN